MKISIIIPAYNEEKLLPRCLESIFSSNLPENYEVIVVNNASIDKTEEEAKKFEKVTLIFESQKGVTRARQAGYLASSGDILVFFDADTKISKNWFDIAINKFKNDPELMGVSGPYHYDNISKPAIFLESIYNNILMPAGERIWQGVFRQGGIMLLGGNFAVRREVLDQIGGFDTDLDFYGEDTNLTRRVAKIGRIEYLNKLFVESSPRRFVGDGCVKVATKYVFNFLGEWIFKKPLNKIYRDFR
jgi:glycosyltransferase involved in cell wall biosynthesis